MENSHGSSMRKSFPDNHHDHDHDNHDDKIATAAEDCTQEESGWTAYFQDFSNTNINNTDNNINHNIIYGTRNYSQEISSFSYTSSSLVSDAASYAAWKISDHHNNSLKAPRKLNFKKTRAKVISEDDSLEDTASSPVNSPKVCDMIKTKAQTDELIDNSMGKKGTSECYSELHREERSLVDFNEKNECIDLKKRGLCLVPLSMPFIGRRRREGKKYSKRSAIEDPSMCKSI